LKTNKGNQRSMFTIGLVHTRDHDLGCPNAEPELAAKHSGRKDLIYMR